MKCKVELKVKGVKTGELCGKDLPPSEQGICSHLRGHTLKKDITPRLAQILRHELVQAPCCTGSMGGRSYGKKEDIILAKDMGIN